MTGYNRMWRCDGGQRIPYDVHEYPRGRLLGQCQVCRGWFRLYGNGKVVMHKRKLVAC